MTDFTITLFGLFWFVTMIIIILFSSSSANNYHHPLRTEVVFDCIVSREGYGKILGSLRRFYGLLFYVCILFGATIYFSSLASPKNNLFLPSFPVSSGMCS